MPVPPARATQVVVAPCIHYHFEAQVDRTPNAVAALCEDRRLTYRELDARANQIARHLRKLGVGPEVLVGVCLERSLDLLVSLLGILKAGGAYLPLDPTYPTERLEFMADDAELEVLLTHSSLADRLPRRHAAVVCLDVDAEHIAGESTARPGPLASPENLAYVIYTSGSTGRPKGVMLEHDAVMNTLCWLQKAFALGPEDTVAQKTASSFTDSVWELFWPIQVGSKLTILPDHVVRDPEALYRALEAERVTVTQFVPPQLNAFLERVRALRPADPLPALRWIFNGGEALPPKTAQAWYALFTRAKIANIYGMTESAIYGTWAVVEPAPDGGEPRILVGRAIDNATVYVLDRGLQPCPPGVPGEIHLGGRGLARGYLNRPELTAERFILDPFADRPDARLYRTGDLGRLLPDGNVEYLGRLDHQVKIRGHRIELGEIEAVLGQHPAVERAVVMVREENPGDRRLVAYLVAATGEPPGTSELRAFLAAKLPEAWLPSAFVTLDRFPLTPSGKVDRRALPAPDHARPELAGDFVAPGDERERALAEIWERLLCIRPIGVADDFFELGGDSLLAVSLVAEVEERFDRKLPLSLLVHHRTVGDLATILRQEGEDSDGWSPLVAIQPEGSRPPFFCFHSEGGNVLEYEPLARLLGPDQPFFALQARGLDGTPIGEPNLEDMAADLLAAVRSVQPSGPYYLGGYCLGGVLALEAARHLLAVGEEVDLVALIQSETPDYPQPAATSTTVHRIIDRGWRRFGREFSNMSTFQGGDRMAYIRMRARHVARRIRVRLERIADRVGEGADAQRERSRAYILQRLAEAHERAFRRYQPRLYRGRVAIFRAGLQPLWIVPDPTLGWGRYLEEPELYEVPGYHHNILTEPRVQQLARALRTSLDRARLTVAR